MASRTTPLLSSLARRSQPHLTSPLFRARQPRFSPSLSAVPTPRLPPASIRLAHSIPRPRQRPSPRQDSLFDVDAGNISLGTSTPPEGGSNRKKRSSEEREEDFITKYTQPTPYYELTFTCIPCGARSAHSVSKQGYHQGSVLITCPGCRNRHVISDHLGIFSSSSPSSSSSSDTTTPSPKTVEELVRARGGLVKRGTLGEDGDVEFWEDGSTTSRAARKEEESVVAYSRPGGEQTAEEAAAERDAAPGSTFRR